MLKRQDAQQGDLLAFGAVTPEVTEMRIGLLHQSPRQHARKVDAAFNPCDLASTR